MVIPANASLREVEDRALALSEEDRVSLVSALVRSLTPLEDETAAAWLDEAERRDREMGEDSSAGVPLEDVLRDMRTGRGEEQVMLAGPSPR